MWEVGLKENVLHSYFIEQPARRCLLEPVTRVNIAGEILGRQQVEIRPVLFHPIAHELVIQRFEREWNPADPALYRHKLNAGVARQHSRHNQITQLDAVAEEEFDREFGKGSHAAVRGNLVPSQPQFHAARADMETDREIKLHGYFP